MKKADIINMETIAYYSGLNGIEIKYIEYGFNDYIYCVSGAWGEKANQKPHKLKVYYNNDNYCYIKLYGYRIPLNECLRANI